MKFIEDYLSELFGVTVCDVRVEYLEPTRVVPSYSFGDREYRGYSGGRGLIQVTIAFKAFSHELPHRKGSLLMTSKNVIYANVSEYMYTCLNGEETKNMFEYALGKED